jgi:hypothetical protein
MKMLNSRSSRIASRMTIACAVLSMGSLAWAQTENSGRAEDEGACSNQTLRGDYGYAAQGVLLGVPGLPTQAPFRSVGMTHFDGRGNLSWVEHTVINGRPLGSGWTPAHGTYAVNPNCTGTAVISTPNSPAPLNLAFVIVRNGKEIHTVLDADAISTVFIKVE